MEISHSSPFYSLRIVFCCSMTWGQNTRFKEYEFRNLRAIRCIIFFVQVVILIRCIIFFFFFHFWRQFGALSSHLKFKSNCDIHDPCGGHWTFRFECLFRPIIGLSVSFSPLMIHFFRNFNANNVICALYHIVHTIKLLIIKLIFFWV